MSPADKLRAQVVTRVLWGVLGLTAGLYGLIGYLLIARDANAVPDALWLAAGGAATAVIGWLNNSKGNGPTEVTTAPGDAVATVPAEFEEI